MPVVPLVAKVSCAEDVEEVEEAVVVDEVGDSERLSDEDDVADAAL